MKGERVEPAVGQWWASRTDMDLDKLIRWAKASPRGRVVKYCDLLLLESSRSRGAERLRLHRAWKALNRLNRKLVNEAVGNIDGSIEIGSQ